MSNTLDDAIDKLVKPTIDNAAAIRAGIEMLLKPVDAAWEQSVIDAYVHTAREQLKFWTEYLGKPEPKHYEQRKDQPRYVLWTPPADYRTSYMPVTFAQHKQRLADGQISANLKAATADAKETYRQTREAFVLRTTEKISYVVQDQKVQIVGFIEFNRMIEGNVTARLGKGDDGFTLKVSVKTNYRYGHNAANGVLTVYSQYPATFAGARVDGQNVLAQDLSEEVLANRISGLPIDHKERASREQIDARKAKMVERTKLEDLKRAYYDIAHDHDYIVELELALRKGAPDVLDAKQRERYEQLVKEYRAKIAKRCAAEGIADPGSKAVANIMRKGLIAQIKQMKGKA